MFIAQYSATLYLSTIGGIAPIGGASDVAPGTAGLLTFALLNVTAPTNPGTGFSITFKNANGEDVYAYAVRSLKQSNARNFYKGPWNPGTFLNDSVPDGGDGDLEFTGLDEGGVYFARIRLLSQSAGRRVSNEFTVRAKAATTT